MANIKLSRKEFERYIRINPEIERKISMFGTPLESINENEVEIEIFPNRPDLLSLQGYLRGFLAFLGKKTGLKKYKLQPPLENYEVKIDKSVKEVRPFTACAIVKNLNFDSEKIKEIIDIQEKIHTTLGRDRKKIAIGIYPLEKISLPIRYEARKPEDIKFIPLEMDKEMSGLQILQRHPTGREYAHLLKDKEKFPIFIDSKDKILSMPPIINSHKTGKITEKTKEVFIECSGFDFEILSKTLNILVTMLADMGGKIYQMKLNYDKEKITPNLTPEKMKINLENINKLLGLELSEKESKKLLEKMGYDYKDKEVLIPAWRTDILHEVDIAEDIAIAYGYENFIPEIPEISTIGSEDKKEIIKRKISEILAGLNFLEISSYHLVTKNELKKTRQKSEIEIEKSKTEYKFLRPCLLTSMLKILSENIDNEYPQKLFEIGKVFSRNIDNETGIEEKEKLIVSITPGNFTELKQVLEYLEEMLSIKLEIQESENESFIPGRIGKIIFNGKDIGTIGEIKPSLLKSAHLKMPLSLMEIELDDILEKLVV
ncbi:MAG: phenylalanine--tRNA ligase subunit beta [Nanoarchaeota archaeon]|nr:phenylalanine--tRNA ligase subunit beta [Nanoarchaeota archaeon]